MKLEPNTTFDRYTLLRKLGEGGYSEVWLVEDTLADVKCAIKIFLPSEQMNEQGLDVFKDEYKIIHNLNHPNLLKYNHLGIYNGYPYLEMPFCDGGSAEQLIGKCDERKCWEFLHDVAAGLAHLHSQNPPIIHQDIKPDNILISQGDYVITDFGISLNTQSGEDEEGVIKGTKPYMPPEKFTEGYSGPIMAGDIWALGASAFELITGHLPFPQGGTMQKVDTVLPHIAGNYSDDLKDLIARCMSYHRWDRPLARDIEELAAIKLDRRTVSGSGFGGNTNEDNMPYRPPAYTSYQPVRKGAPIWLIVLLSAVVIGITAVSIVLLTKPKDTETIYINAGSAGGSAMPSINTGGDEKQATQTRKQAKSRPTNDNQQTQQPPQQQTTQPTAQPTTQPQSIQYGGEE
jgi:serine/threonine protein kinase